jgi:hypothetical protein
LKEKYAEPETPLSRLEEATHQDYLRQLQAEGRDKVTCPYQTS